MVHAYRGIVNNAPPSVANGQAREHIVMHLRTNAAQPRIEPDRPNGGQSKSAVDTLKNIDITGGTKTEMMVADDAAKPENLAANPSCTHFGYAVLVHPIPSAHSADFFIRDKMRLDSRNPIWPGCRVVIRNHHHVTDASRKAGIQCLNLTRNRDLDQPKRDSLTPRCNSVIGGRIPRARNNQNLVGLAILR